MAKKRKKYIVTTNSEAFACSLVTSPAVEEEFIFFNEDKPLIEKFADEKKHMITGVVAIPNKPIFRRNEDGEEYDIVFSAEAIEKMAKDFLKEYRQHEVTLQHEENADGVYLVEQWIKTDMVYDKSLSVGLSRELPVGSWIQTYYVDSNDVWQRIESGELRGFSLECLLGLEEFESQIKNNNNMIETNDMFWEKLKNTIKEVFGVAKEKNEIEELAANSGLTVEAYVNEVEAERQRILDESLEMLEEETPTEPTVEAPTTEEPAQEAPVTEEPSQEEPTVEEPITEEPNVETPPAEDKRFEELINSLKDEINALKEMNNGLNDKIKALSKEPSIKPVNTNAKNGGNGGSSYDNWREQLRQMVGY